MCGETSTGHLFNMRLVLPLQNSVLLSEDLHVKCFPNILKRQKCKITLTLCCTPFVQ